MAEVIGRLDRESVSAIRKDGGIDKVIGNVLIEERRIQHAVDQHNGVECQYAHAVMHEARHAIISTQGCSG